MLSISYAALEDKQHVCSYAHFSESEFELKVRDKRCYMLHFNKDIVGTMVFNLIFDFIPFLTMFYIDEPYRRKGFGRAAMAHWEDEMRSLGYKAIMISTQADENGQHFYRKLGYKDMGSIVIGGILPYNQQAIEIFMGKSL